MKYALPIVTALLLYFLWRDATAHNWASFLGIVLCGAGVSVLALWNDRPRASLPEEFEQIKERLRTVENAINLRRLQKQR